MTRVQTQTSQVQENKIEREGDGPAQDRPAQGAGGQPPYDLEYIKAYINKDIRDLTLKELGDLALAIEYFVEWAMDNGYGPDDKINDIISEIEIEVG